MMNCSSVEISNKLIYELSKNQRKKYITYKIVTPSIPIIQLLLTFAVTSAVKPNNTIMQNGRIEVTKLDITGVLKIYSNKKSER